MHGPDLQLPTIAFPIQPILPLKIVQVVHELDMLIDKAFQPRIKLMRIRWTILFIQHLIERASGDPGS
jgi:hypothetical protein